MLAVAGPGIDSDVRSVLDIYGVGGVNWIDHVDEWSRMGRDKRSDEASER
jgi:hypothetical protein